MGHTETIIHELPIDEEGGSYLPTARVVDALLEKKVTAGIALSIVLACVRYMWAVLLVLIAAVLVLASACQCN